MGARGGIRPISSGMLKPVLRWVFILACLLAVGPLACAMTRTLHDSGGGPGASLLVCGSVSRGILIGVGCMLAAGVVGVLGAHQFSLGTGFVCAGLVLSWAGWGLGTADEIIRGAGPVNPLPRLAVEGLLLGVGALVMTSVLLGASRSRQPAPGAGAVKASVSGWAKYFVHGAEHDSPVAAAVGLALMAALVAGALAAVLVAVSFSRGQLLAATIIAGVLGGIVSQSAAASMRVTLTPLVPIVAMIVLAVAGPFMALAAGHGSLISEVYAGTLMGLGRPGPMLWCAGALVGAPLGISWGGAMLDARAAEFA